MYYRYSTVVYPNTFYRSGFFLFIILNICRTFAHPEHGFGTEKCETRMHSSRVRNHSLQLPSRGEGVYLPREGAYPGGCLPRGCLSGGGVCRGGTPLAKRIIDRCKNITLSQISFAGSN